MSYTTAREAKTAIIQAIEGSGEITDATTAFDIDAIFTDCYTYNSSPGDLQKAGFVTHCSPEDFWISVERHATDQATFTVALGDDTIVLTSKDGDVSRIRLPQTFTGTEEQIEVINAALNTNGWESDDEWSTAGTVEAGTAILFGKVAARPDHPQEEA